MKHSPGHARKAVEERDKGVCAKCGLDTAKLETTMRRLRGLECSGIKGYDCTENKAARRYGIERDRLDEILGEADMHDSREKMTIMRRKKWPAWEPPPLRGEPLVLTPAEVVIVAKHRRLKRLAGARLAAIRADLTARRFDLGISLWQADHIVEVVMGGGLCGLENYQTLCTACHKEKTADLAKRRALIRRGLDPDNLPPDPQPTLF